jgi:integrase
VTQEPAPKTPRPQAGALARRKAADAPNLRLVGPRSNRGDSPEPRPLSTLELEARIEGFLRSARSEATRRAYVSDWKHFLAFCEAREMDALPAEPGTVAMYLAAYADALRVSTLERRLAAISQVHQGAGYPDPPTRHSSVRRVFAGIRREVGGASVGKSAILTEDLRRMVAALPDTLLGRRDRALLLVGFAGAFRRAELVALDVRDAQFTRAGLVVHVRRSKTDQDGKGDRVGIPNGKHPETCPVTALRAWLDAAGIRGGAIFRYVDRHGKVRGRSRPQAVAIVVQRAAKAIGLDPRVFGGHSLRAGLATSAAIAGVTERKIMDQTRHTSERMLRRYIRDGEMFRDNAAEGAGL